jgi:hypothetical protein
VERVEPFEKVKVRVLSGLTSTSMTPKKEPVPPVPVPPVPAAAWSSAIWFVRMSK